MRNLKCGEECIDLHRVNGPWSENVPESGFEVIGITLYSGVLTNDSLNTTYVYVFAVS